MLKALCVAYCGLVASLAKMYEENLPVNDVLAEMIGRRQIIDPLDLAELHISNKEIPVPIFIYRPLPNGTIDVWNRTEMILPFEIISTTFN